MDDREPPVNDEHDQGSLAQDNWSRVVRVLLRSLIHTPFVGSSGRLFQTFREFT